MAEQQVKLDVLWAGKGVPPARTEHHFHPERDWRFDYAWPRYKVALEKEGGTRKGGRHNRHDGYEEDCRKYTEAQILGWLVVRATSEMVGSGEALTLLLRALEARGMTDT